MIRRGAAAHDGAILLDGNGTSDVSRGTVYIFSEIRQVKLTQ